jgi:hypothetical protein
VFWTHYGGGSDSTSEYLTIIYFFNDMNTIVTWTLGLEEALHHSPFFDDRYNYWSETLDILSADSKDRMASNN